MGAPFPGPYDVKYHPWCKELLNCDADVLVTLKSAQGGFTEVEINRAFYTLDVLKRDVLYVLPTATNATDFSKARFGGALALSDYIQSIFTSTNTVGLKQAGANNLYIRGSRGDSNLKSVPASLLVLDEADEMDQAAIAKAVERLSGQVHKQISFVSTPTIPSYGVHKQYLTTTQEHFVFRCPCCSRHTELLPEECLVVTADSYADPKIKDSYYICKQCKNRLPVEDKWKWLAGGHWQPTCDTADPCRRGFHINQMYSSTIAPWEFAQAKVASMFDDAAAQEYYNQKCGLPYVGAGAQVTVEQTEAAKRSFSMNDPRPDSPSSIFTLGVDQGKLGYAVVVEWFVDDWRDPNRTAHGKVRFATRFDQLNMGYETPDLLMSEWQILAAVTDADPEITVARNFCRRFRKHAWACRYRRGVTGNEMSEADADRGAPILTVDRTFWMGTALGRFRAKSIEIPGDIPEEFCEHIRAPVARWVKNDEGELHKVYVKTAADHFAHALTYAEIALPMAIEVSRGNSNI